MTVKKLPIEENLRRFHSNYVVMDSGCWEWTGAGALCGSGHGVTRYDGKKWLAHRLSYWLFKGEIGDKCVCHSCDNPRCVNPDHLWLGTHADNMHDRDRKGRNNSPIGTACHNAKLTPEAVSEILVMLSLGESQNRISKKFGVRQGTIANIVRGKSWRHVTGYARP